MGVLVLFSLAVNCLVVSQILLASWSVDLSGRLMLLRCHLLNLYYFIFLTRALVRLVQSFDARLKGRLRYRNLRARFGPNTTSFENNLRRIFDLGLNFNLALGVFNYIGSSRVFNVLSPRSVHLLFEELTYYEPRFIRRWRVDRVWKLRYWQLLFKISLVNKSWHLIALGLESEAGHVHPLLRLVKLWWGQDGYHIFRRWLFS